MEIVGDLVDVQDFIEEYHREFISALQSDEAPLSPLALFWYEIVSVIRDPAKPSAISRGTAFLHYQQGGKKLKEVPGQDFPVERLPARVCQRLLSEHAASWEGPRSLSFRYDRTENGWAGGGAWESSASYRDQVLSRRELDARMAAILRALWTPETQGIFLNFGTTMTDDPGPRLRIKSSRGNEFVSLPDAVMEVWLEYERHVQRFGHHHLYSAFMTLDRPDGELSEGRTVTLRYGR